MSCEKCAGFVECQSRKEYKKSTKEYNESSKHLSNTFLQFWSEDIQTQKVGLLWSTIINNYMHTTIYIMTDIPPKFLVNRLLNWITILALVKYDIPMKSSWKHILKTLLKAFEVVFPATYSVHFTRNNFRVQYSITSCPQNNCLFILRKTLYIISYSTLSTVRRSFHFVKILSYCKVNSK